MQMQVFSPSSFSGKIQSHKWNILRKMLQWIKTHEIYRIYKVLIILPSKLHFSCNLASSLMSTLYTKKRLCNIKKIADEEICSKGALQNQTKTLSSSTASQRSQIISVTHLTPTIILHENVNKIFACIVTLGSYCNRPWHLIFAFNSAELKSQNFYCYVMII